MYSVSSVDYLFHTDSHGWMSASERGGYCLSSELKRNLDGGSLAVQRLNSFDYLSADVRQMLYGFSSVSNLFNICGLYWSASGRGCSQLIHAKAHGYGCHRPYKRATPQGQGQVPVSSPHSSFLMTFASTPRGTHW